MEKEKEENEKLIRKGVRTGSQSPPLQVVPSTSPRILHKRTNYHHQKNLSSLESAIFVHKSTSNSPTLHPLKLINRRIPPFLVNKTVISPRLVHLDNSPKKKIYERSPKM